jgi:hypothetical protein
MTRDVEVGRALVALLRDADWLVDVQVDEVETPAGVESRRRVQLRMEHAGVPRHAVIERSGPQAVGMALISAFWAVVFGESEEMQMQLRALWLRACGVTR